MSVEEEKGNFAISETSSVHSDKKSNASSSKNAAKARRERRRRNTKNPSNIDEVVIPPDEEEVLMAPDNDYGQHEKTKKVVHFNDQSGPGHIELRDLKEKDFLDLIDSKN